MVGKKITDLAELSSAAVDALFLAVDVDDPSMDPTGTDKRITYANLIAPLLAKASNLADVADRAAALSNLLPDQAGHVGGVLTTDGSGAVSWGEGGGGAGTVTSVDASGGTTGFGFTGGPITGSGTLTLIVSDGAEARSSLGLGSASTSDASAFDAAGSASTVQSNLSAHAGDKANPHAVTAAQVGAYTTAQADALLGAKAADNAVVHLAGAETIAGSKTFSSTITGSISGTASTITGSIAESQVTGLAADLSALSSGLSGKADASSVYTTGQVDVLLGGKLSATIATPSAGQFVRYDGSNWVNASIDAADVPDIDAAKLASGTLDQARLPLTSVVAGSYTAADITVDATGRITAAASGSAGGGGTPGGSEGEVQFNSSGAFGGSPALTLDAASKVLRVGATGGAYAGSIDRGILIDVTGTSGANPCVLGFAGTAGSGYRGRFDFDGGYSGLQAGTGTRVQLYSYWGVEIRGNSEAGAPAYATGGPGDDGLRVVNATGGAVGVGIVAAPAQSANILEARDSSGTLLSGFGPDGRLILKTVDADSADSPATGTVEFNTASGSLRVYDGGGWVFVGAVGGGGGTVTSVGLSAPDIFNISGSPVTGSGTLALGLASQAANAVFAGPGAADGTPAFRALIAGDIPDLSGTYLTVATAASTYLTPTGDGSGLTGITQSQVSGLVADLAAKQDNLPDQSASAGKFLTTDGSTLSWGAAGGDGGASFSPANFPAYSNASPADGDVWYGIAQKALAGQVNGLTQRFVGCIFSQSSTVTITGNLDSSIVGSGVGTTTLPADFLVPGKTLRVSARGLYSSSTGAVTVKFGLGSTTLINFSNSINPGVTNAEWLIELMVTCQSSGVSGSVVAVGTHVRYSTATAIGNQPALNSGGAVAIDTTSPLAVTLSINPGSVSNSFSCQILTIEALN